MSKTVDHGAVEAARKIYSKPTEKLALLWTGLNYEALAEFLNPGKPIRILGTPVTEPHPATICTLEGDMTADPGDWIIRGIAGEFYPCKPDIFAKSYSFDAPDSTQVVLLREQNAELRQVLTSLANEVSGALGFRQAGLRELLGNSNVNCLQGRVDEARAILSKVKGQ